MTHQNKTLSTLLQGLDLGSSVAELDTALEAAMIDTSALSDLLNDRVDLIPGTKGSGKSALFRIFVDFLPDLLLRQRKVVIAHGVQAPGDPVFHAFTDRFSQLSENEFVSFWCIYLVSLAHEQFIKGDRYREFLAQAGAEINIFRTACLNAKIPEVEAKKSLRSILEWSLHVLQTWRPRIKFQPPGEVGEFELDLFGSKRDEYTEQPDGADEAGLPKYLNDVKDSLEAVLQACKLSLWLMVDRLDEVFPRRSDVERTALRGLLRAMRYFSSPCVRVKVFLRDDMLEEVVRTEEGFTALTHVTVRQADTLRWTQDQILAMVVKRIFASKRLAAYLKIDRDQLEARASYRKQAFDLVFPPTVFKGAKQSTTVRWICNHCADGRGVVTPRDVLDLLIRAKQRQQDLYSADLEGASEFVIGGPAIQYGFEELSKRKRDTYLRAEFPHLWKDIEKFQAGKTDYDGLLLATLLGSRWKLTVENLVSIGFLSKGKKGGEEVFSIPFLYRHGMDVTQGRAH